MKTDTKYFNILNHFDFIMKASEIFSIISFLLMWPLTTFYIATARSLMEIAVSMGPNDSAWSNLGTLGMLMLFVYPLVMVCMLGSYYMGIALAIASLRPLPILLAAIAWLAFNDFLPRGVVGYEVTPDWTYPLLYSALVILVATLSWMRGYKKSS
jgi:hypothetical protein